MIPVVAKIIRTCSTFRDDRTGYGDGSINLIR